MDTLRLAIIRVWGDDWKFKGWWELYCGQQGRFHPANLSISSLDDSNRSISNLCSSNVDIVFAHAYCRLHLTTFNRVPWPTSCSFKYLLWSYGWRKRGIVGYFCVSFSEEWIVSSEESNSGVGSNSTTTTTAEQEKLSWNKGESKFVQSHSLLSKAEIFVVYVCYFLAYSNHWLHPGSQKERASVGTAWNKQKVKIESSHIRTGLSADGELFGFGFKHIFKVVWSWGWYY